MQLNDRLHGFTVRRVCNLDEINARAVELEYDKNGAHVLWLDRDDDNMTFSVAFKTVPDDDTGVFHILEHSVLCGSDKYPVKEPFVNLIKTSLSTFLNALTFPDKTMYPISSRNKRDFLNLADVYMDAVFHPAIYRNPDIFRQEGWHYETDGKTLTRSGVVYSEMKGVYTSVEAQAAYRLSRLLYGDTCYGKDSGGNPDHIPELTYERFINRHQTFYHPSNAFFVLDGRVPTDEILTKIADFIDRYDRAEPVPEIPEPQPQDGAYDEGEYAVEPGTETENRALYTVGWLTGKYDDKLRNLAVNVLCDALCGSNEAPLTAAVLAEDLAENVTLSGSEDGLRDMETILTVTNTDASKKDRLTEVIRTTLSHLAQDGIDKDRLTASINALEFMMRERESGATPRGILYAISALDTWIYGGDYTQNLQYGDVFDRLRDGIENGLFTRLLQEIFIDNPHTASVFLTPSDTLGERKKAEQEKALQESFDRMTEDERKDVADRAAALLKAQQMPDSPEGLATLPTLPPEEVDRDIRITPVDEKTADGVKVYSADVPTEGIVYAEMYFDASDLDESDLSALAFMTDLIGELPTERHSVDELQNIIKTHLGAFSVITSAQGKAGNDLTACKPYAVASVSLLQHKEDVSADIIGEVLNETVFDDTRRVAQLLGQKRIILREKIMSSGSSVAVGIVSAAFSSQGVIAEATSGYKQYEWVCAAEKELKQDAAGFCKRLADLAKRVFTRDRLTVLLTGHPSETYAEKLTNTVPKIGVTPVSRLYQPTGLCRRGIIIPSDISFSAMGTNLIAHGRTYSGDMAVGAMNLTYGLLWNTVRVQNGAYGTGLRVGALGALRFMSYRDPNPTASLACFATAGQYLVDHLPAQKELDTQIIGTVGDSEPLYSPRLTGLMANVNRAFTGISDDEKRRYKAEMLSATPDDLRRFGATVQSLADKMAKCVIGAKDLVKKCKELDDVITLK